MDAAAKRMGITRTAFVSMTMANALENEEDEPTSLAPLSKQNVSANLDLPMRARRHVRNSDERLF
jgi:hypothetical protein